MCALRVCAPVQATAVLFPLISVVLRKWLNIPTNGTPGCGETHASSHAHTHTHAYTHITHKHALTSTYNPANRSTGIDRVIVCWEFTTDLCSFLSPLSPVSPWNVRSSLLSCRRSGSGSGGCCSCLAQGFHGIPFMIRCRLFPHPPPLLSPLPLPLLLSSSSPPPPPLAHPKQAKSQQQQPTS